MSDRQMTDGMGNIVSDGIAADTIAAADIAASAVDSSEIADGAIDTVHLSASAITASTIATSTITAQEIATSTITAQEIADATIDTAQLAASSVTATALATSAITATQIADDVVGSANLAKAYEASTIDIGTDASGDGTATYVFGQTFAAAPAVTLTVNESMTTYRSADVTSITGTHCVLALYGVEPTSATYSTGVIVMEKG